MKKVLAVLLAMVMTMTAMAGCGSGEKEETKKPAETEAGTEAAGTAERIPPPTAEALMRPPPPTAEPAARRTAVIPCRMARTPAAARAAITRWPT